MGRDAVGAYEVLKSVKQQFKGSKNDDDDDDDSDNWGSSAEDSDGNQGNEKSSAPKTGLYEEMMEKGKNQRKQKQEAQATVAKESFGELLKSNPLPTTGEKVELWHSQKLPLRKNVTLNDIANFSMSLMDIQKLYAEAEDSFMRFLAIRKSGQPWLFGKIATEGTSLDRIRMLVVQLATSDFIYRLHLLDQLLSVAEKPSRDSKKQAVEALTDLWLDRILPKDRCLRDFPSQPFVQLPPPSEAKDREKVLINWLVEDRIKKSFSHFLHILKLGMADQLKFMKNFFLFVSFKILNGVPEQHNVLITLLTEKLGDKTKVIAAKSASFLVRAVENHSNMLPGVVHEIERFLFRANNPMQARYYAVLVFSRLQLRPQDMELANHLLGLYLNLFKQVIGEGDVSHRVVNTLMKAVRNIMRFAGKKFEMFKQHFDLLFTIAALGPFLHRVSALTLLLEIMKQSEEQTFQIRYYVTFYRLLQCLPAVMPKTDKLVQFFSLLYNSLVFLKDTNCLLAFVHRLLQMCQYQVPTFICSVLLMLAELCRKRPTLKALISDPPANGDATYSPSARSPFKAEGGSQCLWLLEQLTHHYHPSIVKFSIFLLRSTQLEYNGNPLIDFSMTKFLDSFSYKRPKNRLIAQIGKNKVPRERLLYNSEEFRNLPPERVAMDEIFFYKFQKQKEEMRVREVSNRKQKPLFGKKKAEFEAQLADREMENAALKADIEKSESDESSAEDGEDDIFNRFSYNSLDAREIGGETAGISEGLSDDEDWGSKPKRKWADNDDEEEQMDDDEDEFSGKGSKKMNRTQRRAQQRKDEHVFDVTRGDMRPRDVTIHGDDLDELIERSVLDSKKRAGRGGSQGGSRGAGGRGGSRGAGGRGHGGFQNKKQRR